VGGKRSPYRVFVGKPEGKRPLARLKLRWDGNIETDLREIGWGFGLDSSGS
jgi:hypothetical protein